MAAREPLILATDECSICIEPLVGGPVDTLVAQVLPCSHYYHDLCIRSWTQQANTCPSCRVKFNLVQLIDKYGEQIYEYEVEDLKMKIDPDYLAPQAPEEPEVEDCCICCGLEDGPVTRCAECTISFHRNCLRQGERCPLPECSALSSMLGRSRRRTAQSRATEDMYNRLLASNVVVSVPTPSATPNPTNPEEDEAWVRFEEFRKNPSRTPPKNEVPKDLRKFKRPSRRGKAIGSSSKKVEKVDKVEAVGSKVLLLLSEMQSNSATMLKDKVNRQVINLESQRLYCQLSPPMSPEGSGDERKERNGKAKMEFS